MDLVLASRISILLVHSDNGALLFTFQRYNIPLGLFVFMARLSRGYRQAVWYLFLFVCLLQGARALSTFVGRFTDPELSRLASCLPLRCLGAKADSTIERYSRAFEKF